MKIYLTTNEAASLLGIARTSLLNWIEKGDIPFAVTPGGHRRFQKNDLLVFAQKHGFDISSSEKSKTPTTVVNSRVLIVDDDEDFRKFASDCLDLTGDFEVKEAANGLDAAVLVGSWKPNIVLLDLCMPKMDGYEFCSFLRSNKECGDIRIAIVSAFTKDDTEGQLKDLQIDALISKPIGIRDFVEKIRKIIQ